MAVKRPQGAPSPEVLEEQERLLQEHLARKRVADELRAEFDALEQESSTPARDARLGEIAEQIKSLNA